MSDVLMRIQKFLNLSRNTSNEHEAANAAARARALMAEHEITEAELRVADSSNTHQAEPITKGHYVSFGTSKRVGWHWYVTAAVARSYGVKPYWSGAQIGLFGRLAACQATEYTARYLVREVSKLCDDEAARVAQDGHGSPTRRWRNAFRIGAAARLSKRLKDHGAPGATAAQRGHAKAIYGEDETATLADAAVQVPVSPSAGALILIQRDQQEVEEEYERFSKHWKGSVSVGRVTSGDGYRAGSAAAKRIVLSGARGSLKRGTGVLP